MSSLIRLLKSHCKPILFAVQWVCGLFGHSLKGADWGYGGGDKADVWCSRCDKFMQIPASSLRFMLNKERRELMKLVPNDGMDKQKTRQEQQK